MSTDLMKVDLERLPAVQPPIDSIQGQALSPEQRFYLDGFFAGVKQRGLVFADLVPGPNGAGAAAPTESAADETAEERIKREEHPLDAFHRIVDNAKANKAPEKEDIFRFKWHGLFLLTPVKDAFMCRLRIPGGQLRAYQLRELARVAQELTTGYVQITTRANLQLRAIQPKDAPAVLERIQAVGLMTRGAGADNIRNITANPCAGFDPHELIDVTPFVKELAQMIQNRREFYNLPRKFNIALDGGGAIGVAEDTNDIGARAVRVGADNPAGLEPGIYFRIKLGGATGHKSFAQDTGLLVSPDRLVETVLAIVRLFLERGNRSDRKRARLKHLLESWPLPEFVQEVKKRVAGLHQVDPAAGWLQDPAGSEPEAGHPQVGVYPTREAGRFFAGVAVPVGQITPRQMLAIADLADHYGSGEVRLTVWQNLVLPGIPEAFVESVKRALVRMGLGWEQSNLASGFCACTGNRYCKFAATDTKGHAIELMRHLENRFTLDHPINVHLTGCPHSCAQHYMGDIGLLGTKVKVEGETVEGYHVCVGGGFGERQAVGRLIFQGISWGQLKPLVEKVLAGYLRHRNEGETFQAFCLRHDVGRLQEIFSNE